MRPSDDVCLPFVKAFENCLAPVPGRPGFFTTYRCPAGVLTIGYGATNHHEPHFAAGAVWSQRQCDDALARHMALFAAHVDAQLRGAEVTQAQFDALVSWSFNTGGPASSSVWSAARAGDIDGVCERLARWNKGGGRVLRGLVRRRAAECALYRGDIDGALKIAGTRRTGGKAPVPVPIEEHGRANTRPMPPAAEVARETRGTGAAAGAGAATAGAGSLVPPDPKTAPAASPDSAIGVGTVLLIAGALIVAVAGVVGWRRWRHLVREWA